MNVYLRSKEGLDEIFLAPRTRSSVKVKPSARQASPSRVRGHLTRHVNCGEYWCQLTLARSRSQNAGVSKTNRQRPHNAKSPNLSRSLSIALARSALEVSGAAGTHFAASSAPARDPGRVVLLVTTLWLCLSGPALGNAHTCAHTSDHVADPGHTHPLRSSRA